MDSEITSYTLDCLLDSPSYPPFMFLRFGDYIVI